MSRWTAQQKAWGVGFAELGTSIPELVDLEKGKAGDLEGVYRQAMEQAFESGADDVDLFAQPWQRVAELHARELLDEGKDDEFNEFADEREAVEKRIKAEQGKRDIRMCELVARDGSQWRTGTPITFQFFKDHNRKRDLEVYGKGLEPSGNYINHLADIGIGGAPQPGWEMGEATFRNPLVIEWVATTHAADGWKSRLSHHFGGQTGIELARSIRRAGHDAVVTIRVDYGEVGEIVDLRRIRDPDSGAGQRILMKFGRRFKL